VIDEAVGAKFVGLSVKYKLIDTQVCGKKRTRKLWLKKSTQKIKKKAQKTLSSAAV